MNIIDKIKRNPNLIKHSATVHITNKITLLERKLYNVLLKNAFDDMETNNNHKILVSDLCKVVGFNSNNREVLKVALTKLRETGIDINILGKDNKNNWTNIGLCSRVQIDEKTGMCSYGFDTEFVKIFKSPNVYANLNLDVQQKFKSKHSIAIWEFCIEELSVKKISSTHTKIITIDDLKKLLFLEENKYKRFAELNRTVLKPSISEINSKSDINISINTKKQNRKVSHISFFVERKNSFKDSKVITFAEDLERANEEYQKNNLIKTQRQSSIFGEQKEKIIEAEFEELAPTQEKTASKQPKKEQQKEEYPFTLPPIKQLVSLGISKSSIKKEFNQLITEFTKKEVETLFTNFLQQKEIKDVMSGKKQTESKSNYIYQLIKNRSFFNQENLDKIKNQNQKEVNKQQEKEDLKEKYQIRNEDEFGRKIQTLMTADQILENLPKFLHLDEINFSLIESNIVYFLISKSSENPKFQRDNFLREKKKIIKTIKKIDDSIKDIKVAVEDDYLFF